MRKKKKQDKQEDTRTPLQKVLQEIPDHMSWDYGPEMRDQRDKACTVNGVLDPRLVLYLHFLSQGATSRSHAYAATFSKTVVLRQRKENTLFAEMELAAELAPNLEIDIALHKQAVSGVVQAAALVRKLKGWNEKGTAFELAIRIVESILPSGEGRLEALQNLSQLVDRGTVDD